METVESNSFNLQLFKKVMWFVDKFTNYVRIEFKPPNIVITEMDPSRICCFRLILKDILKGKQEGIIGHFDINFSDFNSILDRLRWDSCDISLEVKHSLKTLTFKKGKQQFDVKESDYDLESNPIDTLSKHKWDLEFELNINDFEELIENGSVYSEVMTMSYGNGEVQYESDGPLGKFVQEADVGKESKKSNYSLSYLKRLVRVEDLFIEPFKVSIRKDYPLRIFYDASMLEMKFYIAPRVDYPDFDEDGNEMEEF